MPHLLPEPKRLSALAKFFSRPDLGFIALSTSLIVLLLVNALWDVEVQEANYSRCKWQPGPEAQKLAWSLDGQCGSPDAQTRCLCAMVLVSDKKDMSIIFHQTRNSLSAFGGPENEVNMVFVCAILTAALAALRLMCFLVCVLRAARSAGFSIRLAGQSFWIRFRSWILAEWRSSECPERGFAKQIAKELHLQQARKMFPYVDFMLSIVLIGDHYASWEIGGTVLPKGRDSLVYLYDSFPIPAILILVFFCPFHFNDKLITQSALNALNVLVSGVWAWRYTLLGKYRGSSASSALCWGYGYEYWETPILACRFFQAIFCGNAKLTTVLNLLVTAVDMRAYALATSVADPGEFSKGHWWKKTLLLWMIIVVTWCYETRLAGEAQSLHKALQSANPGVISHRIFRSLCDTVIHMTPDTTITKHSPSLAQFLLRHHDTSFVGRCFSDFVITEDRERLSQLITSKEAEAEQNNEIYTESAGSACAGAAQVRLIDACGSNVCVQIFWFCYNVHGQCFHMAGIKEDVDQVVQTHPHLFDQQHAFMGIHTNAMDMPTALIVPAAIPNCQAEADTPTLTLSRASSFSDSSSNRSDGEELRCAVCINASSPKLDFISTSRKFALLAVSRNVGDSLADWMSQADFAHFRWWLSFATPGATKKLILRPSTSQGLAFFCTCILERAGDGGMTELVQHVVFQRRIIPFDLTFTDMTVRNSWKSSVKRDHSQGASTSFLIAFVDADLKALRTTDSSQELLLAGSLAERVKPGALFKGIMRRLANEWDATGQLEGKVDIDLGHWVFVLEDNSQELIAALSIGKFSKLNRLEDRGVLTCELRVRDLRRAGKKSSGGDESIEDFRPRQNGERSASPRVSGSSSSWSKGSPMPAQGDFHSIPSTTIESL